MPTPLDIARDYAELGLAPIALPYGQKAADRGWRRWQNVAPSGSELESMFDGSLQNVAIIGGRASDGLLVLDAEDEKTFREIGTRLRANGIDTWVVQRPPNGSLHDGGAHFYLRTPKAVRSVRLWPALEVRAQGQYVLAPPSLHPQGGLYQFVNHPPTIFTLPSLDALEWLKLEPAPPRRQIPRLAWTILQGDAATLENYPSRSEAEAAFCASLARAGFDAEDALRLMLKYDGPGKFKELHDANPGNARRYFFLTWKKARKFVETHDSEASRLAKKLRVWATSRPWPGRTGSSDCAIYLAHLTIVERCGRDPHGASARELAEEAGVSWQTAANANSRLVEAKRLEVVTEATPSLSTIWRLLIPPDLDSTLCKLRHSINYTVMECQSMHAHDAFRWQALGKTGGEVWAALQSAPLLKVAKLAKMTGRHETTVRRKLKLMFKLGMAEPMGDGLWRAVPGVDLDQVAEELGTSGTGERQRAKHVRDRRRHWYALERERR